MPLHNIVVAVDGSAPADRALFTAGEQRGAERDLAQRAAELRGRGLEVRTAVRVGAAPDVVAEVAESPGGPGRRREHRQRAIPGSAATRLLDVLHPPLLLVA